MKTPGRAPARSGQGGFTLLEVLIAVVILAVGLSSLFTSEAAAIRIAQRARTTTVATLLARCKMAELEELIAKQGWPGSKLDGRDECCEDIEHDDYSCEWAVDRIVLPEAKGQQAGDSLSKSKDDLKGSTAAGAAAGKAAGAAPGATPPGSPTDPLSSLGVPLGGLPPILGGTGATTGTGSGGFGSTGGTAGTGGGGGDPMAQLVMEMAFPVMKPLIEEQVRRATVKVKWREGESERSFEVVQFLVNELPVLAPTVDEENEVVPGQNAPAGGTGNAGGGGQTGAATEGRR